MTLAFDQQLAAEIGLNEAIFISQLQYWQAKEGVGRVHDDGRKYIKNTLDGWLENFPFWTESQLRRVIKSLLDGGYISRANLNKHGYDRTWWYAVIDESLPTNACDENDKCKVTETTNAFVANEQMHPAGNNTTIPKNTTKTTTKNNSKREEKPLPPHLKNMSLIDALNREGIHSTYHPLANALKEHCSPVKLDKLLQDTWEAIGHDITPEEVMGISNGYWGEFGIGDKPWPSQVSSHIAPYRQWVQAGKPKKQNNENSKAKQIDPAISKQARAYGRIAT